MIRSEIKKVKQKLMDSRPFKILFVVTLFVMLGSGVFAVYVFSMTETSSYVIDSDVGISFSDDFTINELINATDGDVTSVKTITIFNGNGLLSASFDLNSTIIDIVDGCDNFGDVTITGDYNNGTALNNSDTIEIIEGLSDLEITTFVKQYACSQNASYEVTISTE